MSCNDIFDDNQTLFDNSSSATIEPEDEITDVFDGFDFDTRSELSSISDDSEAKPEASEPILNRERNKKSVVGGHIKIDESQPSKFTCTICSRSFSRKQQIRYHDYCVTGKRPLNCDLCGKGFVKKSHLEYHKRTHTGEVPFKCQVCCKGFKLKAKLNRHLKIHCNEKPMKHLCSYCNKTYSDRDSLKKHEQKHKQRFSCTICYKSFSDKFSLKQHVSSHKCPNFVCDVCGKPFIRKTNLNDHKLIHEDVYPFECEICHKTFRLRKDLTQHGVVHDKNSPGHECKFCGITCGRKDNLQRHIKNCHLDPCQKKSQPLLGGQNKNSEESGNNSKGSRDKTKCRETLNSEINSKTGPSPEKFKLAKTKHNEDENLKTIQKITDENKRNKSTNNIEEVRDCEKEIVDFSVQSDKNIVTFNKMEAVTRIKNKRYLCVKSKKPKLKESKLVFPDKVPSHPLVIEANTSQANFSVSDDQIERTSVVVSASPKSSETHSGLLGSNKLNDSITDFPQRSVIVHTDVFKPPVIVSNYSREPVIKSFRTPVISAFTPYEKILYPGGPT